MKKKLTVRYEWSWESVEKALNAHGIYLDGITGPERSMFRRWIYKTNPRPGEMIYLVEELVRQGTDLPLNWETVGRFMDIIEKEAVVTVYE